MVSMPKPPRQESSLISLDPGQGTTPRVSQQELHCVVLGFTCLPFRPRSEQVEVNRPIESSPFLPPPLPPLFSLPVFSSWPPNLFSGLGFPVRALWGGGNMELGKHQGSHCRDYNTHISPWQLPFQHMTSRQDPVRAGIQWHFLSPLQTLIAYTVTVCTASCSFMGIRCWHVLSHYLRISLRFSHIIAPDVCGNLQRINNTNSPFRQTALHGPWLYFTPSSRRAWRYTQPQSGFIWANRSFLYFYHFYLNQRGWASLLHCSNSLLRSRPVQPLHVLGVVEQPHCSTPGFSKSTWAVVLREYIFNEQAQSKLWTVFGSLCVYVAWCVSSRFTD